MSGATFYKSDAIPEAVAGDLTYARAVDAIVIDSNGFAWRSVSASTAAYVPLGVGTAYAAVATSTVTNVAVATTFSTGSFTFAANTLSAGTVIRYFASGTVTSVNAADTLLVQVFLGAIAVAFTPTVVVLANDMFIMSGEIVIRTATVVGPPLVAGTRFASGMSAFGAPAFPTPFVPSFAASASVDTSTTQAITVQATWAAASVNNIVRLDMFDVTLG